MADASRFPGLSLPFAIAGAAGGWLSAGLVATPLVQRAERHQEVAAVLGALLAALTGALIRRWCVADPAPFRFDTPEPEPAPDRPPSDRTWRHVTAVLVAGTISGAGVAALCGAYGSWKVGAVGGFACAVVFVPVCLSVIAAARRAQRARMGSLVAGSDHRAVWGILAATLGFATLEAALDWPAVTVGMAPVPRAAAGMLLVAAVTIAGVLAADVWARRRARRAVREELVPQEAQDLEAADTRVPRLDLGLGDGVSAQVARAAAAYRVRDRTLALVQGDPDQALSALDRAVRRGAVCLSFVAVAAAGHAAARTELARRLFDEHRCERYDLTSCERLADAVRETQPDRALLLYERACRVSGSSSCFALGEMLSERAGDAEMKRRAAEAFGKACVYGDRRGCLALSW